MKALGYIFSILILIAAGLLLFGFLSPAQYQAEAFQTFAGGSCEQIYAMLIDPQTSAQRKAEIASVEILGTGESGYPIWREHTRSGGPIVYEYLSQTPNSEVVIEMKESSLGMTGIWDYQLAPDDSGCTGSISEQSLVSRPWTRTLLVLLGRKATLHRELQAIGEGLPAH